VAIAAEESFYILRFDREAYNEKLEEGGEITDEGVEEAFDVITEVAERFVNLRLHLDFSEWSQVSRRRSGLAIASFSLPQTNYRTWWATNLIPSARSTRTFARFLERLCGSPSI
jgi:hypothetical protein